MNIERWFLAALVVYVAPPSVVAQTTDGKTATELPAIVVEGQKTAKARPKPKKSASKADTKAAHKPASPVAPQPPQDATVTTRVRERNALPPTGTIGQPPEPYAGGQLATGAQVGALGVRSIFDTPLSIKSYTAEGIQNRMATSVIDVFDTDPAVLAVGRGSPFEYLNIRGFVSRQPYDGHFDGLNIPHLQPSIPEFYERVELIKGPTALLYPQLGGIAGTINYVPKYARDADITEITTSITSDSQVRGHVDVGRRYGPAGEWGVRANIVGNTGDTYRRDGESDLAAGSLAVDYRGDRVRFAIYGDIADSTLTDPPYFTAAFSGVGRLPVPDPHRVGSFQDGAFYDAQSSRAYVTGEVDLTPALTAYAKFGASQTESANDAIFDCVFSANGGCQLTPYRYDEYRYYLAGEVGVRALFDTGPIRHRMTVSASTLNDVYSDTGDGYQVFAAFDANFFDPRGPYTRSPVYTTTDYGGRTQLRSLAVADTVSVFNETIQLTLGARRQEVKTSEVFDGDLESFDDAALTPMYGLVVKPGLGLSLYASYIAALEKGGTAGPTAANFPATLPAAISEQKEIGAKWDLRNVALTLALFDIAQPNDATDSAGVFARNGLKRTRGIEFEAFGEPVKGVRIMGGFTLLDPKIVASADGSLDGKAPPGVPDYMVKIGAEWDVPILTGLTLTGLVIHSGQQFADQANAVGLDDWTRVDAGFRYAVTDSIVLRGVIQNVADERYWESAQDGFFLNIGAPRTYALSTTFTF